MGGEGTAQKLLKLAVLVIIKFWNGLWSTRAHCTLPGKLKTMQPETKLAARYSSASTCSAVLCSALHFVRHAPPRQPNEHSNENSRRTK